MLNSFGSPRGEESEKQILDTRVRRHVRILNGALDEADDSTSALMLHGRIDPATLHFLQVASYQRPLADRPDIFDALKDGLVVPSVEIGVRGQDFTTDGDDYIIRSPAFLIDGWQRVGTAMKVLEIHPHLPIRIFASIHFGTDLEWESHRFVALNKNVKRVSPNIHLRNMRIRNDALSALHDVTTTDVNFPLCGKVTWDQTARKGEIVSATTLAIALGFLHMHRIGLGNRTADALAVGLSKIQKAVTPPTFRKNLYTFVNLINDCWPVSGIEHRVKAPQVKASFLFEVARMLSNHEIFWEHNGNTLTISADDRRKLAKFNINDQQIQHLAGSGGASRHILYQLLVNHMNNGRRTQRLRARFENEES